MQSLMHHLVRLVAAATLAGLLPVRLVVATDTDGDGRLDLIDVPSFDPHATGVAQYRDPIEDVDGVNQLTSLDSLYLLNHRLPVLETGDFGGLNNLRELFLRGRSIGFSRECEGLSRIEAGAFDGLANLELMIIRCNRLQRLEPHSFRGVPQLEQLYLNDSLIADLGDDAFHGLANLYHLDLSGNEIARLEPPNLTSLDNLRTLDIGQNTIESIEPGAFLSMANLETLDLIQNRIERIEAGAFEGLDRLQNLLLITNQIAKIEPDGFRGLGSLKTLRLENNPLEEITPEMFRGLGELERIDLRQNLIRLVHPQAFAELHNLRRLSLGGDHLASLNRSLNTLTLLEEFSAWGDDLRVEVGDFGGLKNLRRLTFRANQPTLERGLFEGLGSLTRLSVRGSRVAEIEDGVFEGLTNLQRLELGENDISIIEHGILDNLSNLQLLDLGENRITKIEAGAFKDQSSLQDLELRKNAMTELNLTGASLQSLLPCEDDVMGYWYRGFCFDQQVAHLILDHAELSASSFVVIIGNARSVTDVSLVGLSLSDVPEASFSLEALLSITTLNKVTVDTRWYGLHTSAIDAFDALPGKAVVVVPEPVALPLLALALCSLAALGRPRRVIFKR